MDLKPDHSIMPRRELSRLFHRRLFVVAGSILLLLVTAVSLSARKEHATQPASQEAATQPYQQERSAQSAPSCLTPLRASDSTSSFAEARALLPAIPEEPLPLPPEMRSTAPPLPPVSPPDPDSETTVYGYVGPYYNTETLGGRVTVLDQTLYKWPTSTWKMSGMLRNETRCPVHVTALNARLLGSHGELLAATTASVPVDTLRPGEPSPFVIGASVSATSVHTIDWHVDFAFTEAPDKKLQLVEYFEGRANGYDYDLEGAIGNRATTTTRGVQVVVAWLDFQGNGRVLYVSPATLSRYSAPGVPLRTIDLEGRKDAIFRFGTTEPALIPLLGEARVAIWGTTK
ncbi:MAG TPA: hypothetical protein VHR45_00085 [Thermoanaerobaculia bacterium]|nr:hypothetical protein [Thermoanaerobaculia bacterium]